MNLFQNGRDVFIPIKIPFIKKPRRETNGFISIHIPVIYNTSLTIWEPLLPGLYFHLLASCSSKPRLSTHRHLHNYYITDKRSPPSVFFCSLFYLLPLLYHPLPIPSSNHHATRIFPSLSTSSLSDNLSLSLSLPPLSLFSSHA